VPLPGSRRRRPPAGAPLRRRHRRLFGGCRRRAARFLSACGHDPSKFVEIAPDASTRRHFRGPGPGGRSEIVALYAEGDEGILDRWVACHRLLVPHVRVPEIFHTDRAVPALLLEDFGALDLSERARREPKKRSELYTAAVETAAQLRRIPPTAPAELNPQLDAALFRRELELTRTEFFQGLLAQKWEGRRRAAWDEWVFRLGERLDALPRITCHRDFHGNNLFPLPGGVVGAVDIQDLRAGPLGYDLTSLLFERDAVLLIDDELSDDLMRDYARKLGLGVSDLTKAIRLCRLQRGWKAVGTFARQLRRGRNEYAEFLRMQLASLRALADEEGAGVTQVPEFVLDEVRRDPPAPGSRAPKRAPSRAKS
jgi:aminoglycoside/choline kinase family phosphotransferase